MLRATTTDHRNRPVPLARLQFVSPFARHTDRAARLRAASKLPRLPISRAEVRRFLGYGVVVFPLMIAAALAPSLLTFKLHAPIWALMLAVLPLSLIPALVSIFVVRRAGSDRLAAYYVDADYCASCGFDIRATEPQPDGCRICPECGSAWRITSLRPAPPLETPGTPAHFQPTRP